MKLAQHKKKQPCWRWKGKTKLDNHSTNSEIFNMSHRKIQNFQT